ncbi:MAG: sulfotransferase domain-containing protein [Chloroflexi bacterium]|nr:sulfotransferase domain-containing protein [Chloroflexota bacterium]
MIVLSVGMPRAGSGWHYNLINDLMKTTGCADARDIRKRYRLEHILTEANCNIGVLSIKRLGMLALPAMLNTFVIKAHTGPTRTSRLLSTLGLLRITYIYRDPRDAMFSAYDFGQQALAKGHPNAFSHLSDFGKSMNFIMQHVRIWEKWMNEKNVLVARYEDLLMNYDDEITKLTEFLKLDRSSPEVKKVIEGYRPDAAESQKGASSYKGRIGRFRSASTEEQKAILKEKLGTYLVRMEYDA